MQPSPELVESLKQLDILARDNFSLLRYADLLEALTRQILDPSQERKSRKAAAKKTLETLIQDESNALKILEIIKNLRETYHLPTIQEYEQEKVAIKTYDSFWGELELQPTSSETIHAMPQGV